MNADRKLLNNDWEGYSLFNDIDDDNLRTDNQGTVLANILEDTMKDGMVSGKGRELALGYMENVFFLDREMAATKAKKFLEDRGYTFG